MSEKKKWRSGDGAAMALARRAVLVFVPLGLAGALVLYLLFHSQASAERSDLRAGQKEIVAIAEQWASDELDSLVTDVRYLARLQTLQQWLRTGDPDARRQMAGKYFVLAETKARYDQIRFLDLDGQELVRVDWNAGRPAVVPDDQLQFKAHRYYVREALKLGEGQVYISPFDLNVERGEIERPIKPTIRCAAPVFDANGRKRGVVVLNYLGERLIDGIKALADRGPEVIWLLNVEGDALLGPAAIDESAVVERARGSFARAHPEAWKQISSGPASGQFFANGDLFSYSKVAPLAGSHGSRGQWLAELDTKLSRFWVVAQVPAAVLAGQRMEIARRFAAPSVALVLLLVGVAGVSAGHRVRRTQAEQQIRESETRFRALLESAPDAVVITDAEGRIVLVNARIEELFGYTRDQLIGGTVEALLPDRYRSQHVSHRAGYMTNPRARPMGAGLDLCGLRADGTEFPVEISLSPVRTGERVLIVADIRDVTAQRAAERRIRDLNERLSSDNRDLAAVNEELEAFTYSVSHDLRAPLRAIDGFSQALLEDCADRLEANSRGHLDRVRRAAQHMSVLIDDLLRLSKISRADVDAKDVDLGEMAREIVEALRATEPERSAEVKIEQGTIVRGDSRLLRIVLENLLGNAWKFTARSSPAQIEFGRHFDDGRMWYYVRDNGVGFDMAFADQLFHPFRRLHDSSEFPGTGIGLATVRRILHKHGGLIRVSAEPGKGATFYFTLESDDANDE